MIDFIVSFFAVIFFIIFYFYIGYWFLEWHRLPAEHWISRTVGAIKTESERIFSPLKQKTRRLDVRILLVLDNLVVKLLNTDYILLGKKIWAHVVCLYLKTVLFVLKLKRLFFEKNENKR